MGANGLVQPQTCPDVTSYLAQSTKEGPSPPHEPSALCDRRGRPATYGSLPLTAHLALTERPAVIMHL
jgi:hypothetical protein